MCFPRLYSTEDATHLCSVHVQYRYLTLCHTYTLNTVGSRRPFFVNLQNLLIRQIFEKDELWQINESGPVSTED